MAKSLAPTGFSSLLAISFEPNEAMPTGRTTFYEPFLLYPLEYPAIPAFGPSLEI